MRDIRLIVKERTLDDVPGLPPIRARFACVPRPAIGRLVRHLQTGDLIFFASTRKHLDIFHCGIVVRDADRVLVRHASRSRGGVVEQDLNEFLKANRMAGVIVVRPRSPVGKDKDIKKPAAERRKIISPLKGLQRM